MFTRSPVDGTRPADQLAGLLQSPPRTAVIVGLATNRGMISLSVRICVSVTVTPPGYIVMPCAAHGEQFDARRQSDRLFRG